MTVNINRRNFIKTAGIGAAAACALTPAGILSASKRPPNIIVILADDLGYGDIQSFNPKGKIPTPAIDKLAEQGVSFTDAHSNSAVCTPTRYGLLTGRYAWRSRLKSGVLTGYSPHLLENDRKTIASLLKERGYSTTCVGKWHLGWDWATTTGKRLTDAWTETGEDVDFSQPIQNGPTDFGFDYFFGISGSLDMPPYVYVENNKVTALPDRNIKKNDGYGFYREGPVAPDFKHDEVMSRCTEKVLKRIKEYSAKDNPFFIYYPLTAPHTPILPTEDFQGKSGIGPYGDFVAQCDHTVGQIMKTLEDTGTDKNTLVIFTSDNGCSPSANFDALHEQGHHPSSFYRGYKADIYEGGHRIPFIARWPETIQPLSEYNQTICLTDLFATCAAVSQGSYGDQAGEDSYSLLPAFKGEKSSLREATVHHSVNGSFSIRRGKWKLELCPGSGGWSAPVPEKAAMKGLPFIQLYNMEEDPSEQNNLQGRYPEIIHSLTSLLESYVKKGRSTPGKKQDNTTPVDIWETLKYRENADSIKKITHLGLGASIRKLNSAKIRAAEKGINSLVDGFKGSSSFKDGYWAGVEGDDLVFLVDLKKEREIKSIEMDFLEDQGSWIFLPREVEAAFSLEPDLFLRPRKISHPTPEANQNVKTHRVHFSFEVQKARYVKLSIKNQGSCPSWHPGKGGKAWFFLDEVIIR